MIAKPNEWSKVLKESKGKEDLTDTRLFQLEFWSKLQEFNNASNSKLRFTRAPRARHWYDISIGTSLYHIVLTMNTQAHLLGCEIYISHSKELYRNFLNHKDTLEREIGHQLEWMELPEGKASRIKLSKHIDVNNQSKWQECFLWMNEYAERFYNAFSKAYNDSAVSNS